MRKILFLSVFFFILSSCVQKEDNLLRNEFAGINDYSVSLADYEKRECRYIIIHCSFTDPRWPWTANRLKKFFKDPPPKGRGWSKLGYHDYVEQSGDISFITPINGDKYIDSWELTNNCSGYNSVSHAICMEGGGFKSKNGKMLDKVNFTDAQLKKLVDRVKYLKSIYPKAIVVTHDFLDNKGKTCPVIKIENLFVQ